MNLNEKIRSMSDEELVKAEGAVLAWASAGGPDRKTAQAYKPVLDGLTEVIKPGMAAMMLDMPWEDAVWAIAGQVGGKK